VRRLARRCAADNTEPRRDETVKVLRGASAGRSGAGTGIARSLMDGKMAARGNIRTNHRASRLTFQGVSAPPLVLVLSDSGARARARSFNATVEHRRLGAEVGDTIR